MSKSSFMARRKNGNQRVLNRESWIGNNRKPDEKLASRGAQNPRIAPRGAILVVSKIIITY